MQLREHGLFRIPRVALLLPLVLTTFIPRQAFCNGDVHKVKHIIIMMQENHSFDNYFGALAYAPGSPYHTRLDGCRKEDHNCVDGLSCRVDAAGNLTCFNSNLDDNGSNVFAFHDSRRCALPDLDHSWFGTHQQANFSNPNGTLTDTLSDGFVRVNDATEQLDNGVENPTDDQTMGFYNQDEIPFYYNLAANFAVNDRYFSSMLGPTFTNRSFFMAATSFGHLTTSDEFPPP
jgi:phospholipase C